MSQVTGTFEVRGGGVYVIKIAGRHSEHTGTSNPDAVLRAVIEAHERSGATNGTITVTAE